MKKVVLMSLVIVFAASMGMAKYKGKYADWVKGPVFNLITRSELKAFKHLKSDAAAENFIALFWAKRDPTPDTAANEFKDRFDALVAAADKKFSTPKRRGSLTDRGKILILFGPPTSAQSSDYQGSAGAGEGVNVSSEGFGGGKYGKAFVHGTMEVWLYRKEKLPPCIQQQKLLFRFLKEEKAKDYTMNRQVAVNLQAIEKVKEYYVKHPDLKEVPEYAKNVMRGPTKLALYAADLLARKGSPVEGKGFLEAAPFFCNATTTFLAVQVYFPEKNLAGVGDSVHFSVAVMDDENNTKRPVDEDAAWKKTVDGSYVDRSIVMPAGDYKIAVAVGSADGAPIFSAVQDVSVPDFTSQESEGLWFTLATDVKPLPKAQYITDPFAFNGVKVVPKSDAIFHVTDDIWGFANIFHPALDDTGKPKMTFKIEILKDGKTFRKTGTKPLDAAKLNDGRYAFGHVYNIKNELHLKAGDYAYVMTIKDTISGKVWKEEKPIKIVE